MNVVIELAERERAWSKSLFGNAHMLAVATSIHELDSDEFESVDVRSSTGLARSSVHRLLEILVDVRVLERIARDRGERVQRYKVMAHPFWGTAERIRQDAGEQ
jgi:hypothetical protein